MKITTLLFLSIVSLNSIAQINGISEINTEVYKTSNLKSICDTIASFPVVDTWPTGTAWDGTYLWSCGSDFQYIYKYDTTGVLIDSIPNPSNLDGSQGIVFDGVSLWILAESQDSLYELDITNGSILSQFYLPLNTDGFGLAFNNSILYATQYTDSLIFKINPLNGQIIDSINTEKPLLGIEFINGELYGISVDFSNFYKINETNGSFIDSISWCISYPLGITWDGSYLWNISSSITYGGTQKMYKIDLSLLTLSTTENTQSESSIGLTIFPNPFFEKGTIQFNTINDEFVIIELLNINGRKIKTILNKTLLNGSHNIPIDAEELSSGIYFIRFSVANFSENYKVIIK